MSTWLLHVAGLDDPTGRWYLFWSGIAGDLTYLTAVGVAVGWWRKHLCHVDRCWRLARHPVEGTTFVCCRRHHPSGAPSHEDVIAAHEASRSGDAS